MPRRISRGKFAGRGLHRNSLAHDGHGAAGVEVVAIADNLEGRRLSIATREEPGEIGDGAAQVIVVLGGEEAVIFGMPAAMVAFVGHDIRAGCTAMVLSARSSHARSPLALCQNALWITFLVVSVLAATASSRPRISRKASDALCRAPLLDLLIASFTWLPWLVAGVLGGWGGMLGSFAGEAAALIVWTA